MSDEAVDKKKGEPQREGILVGVHREGDVGSEFSFKYLGDARQIHFERPEDRRRYGGLAEAASDKGAGAGKGEAEV